METQIESKWDPEVQRIITEGTAVTTAIRAAEDPTEVPEALRLVKKVRQDQSHLFTVEDFLISTATAKILNEPFPVGAPVSTRCIEHEEWAYELVANAWIQWAKRNYSTGRHYLRQWSDVLGSHLHGQHPEADAVHLVAITLWANSVEALFKGERGRAHRSFLRTVDLGSSVGTESHPLVLWTFAASYFPSLKT